MEHRSCEAEINRELVDDILRPDGELIGSPGSSRRIRIVPGGIETAGDLFRQLAEFGIEERNPRYPGTLVRLPEIGLVGLRLMSTSGPPTVDVKIRGIRIDEIKFVEQGIVQVTGSKIESLERYLAFRTRESETGLWVFNDVVAEELGLDAGGETARETTLKIVSDLLEAGLVHPGFPTRDGRFESWSLSTGEALVRIAQEWNKLEREPTIGDIVWFKATEKGNEYLANYSPKDSGLAVEEAE